MGFRFFTARLTLRVYVVQAFIFIHLSLKTVTVSHTINILRQNLLQNVCSTVFILNSMLKGIFYTFIFEAQYFIEFYSRHDTKLNVKSLPSTQIYVKRNTYQKIYIEVLDIECFKYNATAYISVFIRINADVFLR